MESRRVSKMPFKVLDAPSLTDDFYLNLVDWSSTNLLAVGLQGAVYIWSAQDNRVTKLCQVDSQDSITSVSWSTRGNHLAVGTDKGVTQIWDVQTTQLVRKLYGHTGRVSSVAWSSSLVSTGSRDRTIL
jgi:cell division cycle 20-like protein 1 (cofactor of APC complex)